MTVLPGVRIKEDWDRKAWITLLSSGFAFAREGVRRMGETGEISSGIATSRSAFVAGDEGWRDGMVWSPS